MPAVDTFLSTSGKTFFDVDEAGKKVRFEFRLWIDTTLNGFNQEAENTIRNQTPPVGKLGYYDLVQALMDWEKLDAGISGEGAARKRYNLKPHQQTAIERVHEAFKKHDRGKLIMACGAENETKKNGLVLFLVPSIALLGQTLREWKSHSTKPLYPICICSDAGVSKGKTDNGKDESSDTRGLSCEGFFAGV